MELLSQTQEQLVREQFPSLVNLRTQVHFTYWSKLHLVTQELCDQLPFSQIFSATSFYRLIDFQLGSLVTAAQRTLTLWALIGVRQYNGSLVDQLALFHDKTFLWHYSVPPKRQEILSRSSHRVVRSACVTSRHAQVVDSSSEKSEHLQWLEMWEI